jgi:hypothetical protein
MDFLMQIGVETRWIEGVLVVTYSDFKMHQYLGASRRNQS